MSSFICQFCNKTLTSKQILTNHQKTTKRCLEIQKNIDQELQINLYDCEYCNYTATKKAIIDRHSKSCFEKHKEVIEKYILKIKDEVIKNTELINNQKSEFLKKLFENDKLIEELKNKLENTKSELDTLKGKLECQKETSENLQKMVMKSRQNNTQYITNNQKIEYSKANLNPYSELKDNISIIIDSKFNKSSFQSIENVATFITNDILNYNNKEYYHCFDNKGTVFHKKNGDEIDVDEKAEKLLNDILPLIVEKSTKIYIEESDYYNDKDTEDKESEKQLISVSKALKNVKNISKRGSDERNLCIRRIANCYCVSSNVLKSYFNLKIDCEN